MINVRLAGGLGNQLFQLASGLRFANYNAEKLGLYKDSLVKYKTSRDYELEKIIDFKFDCVSNPAKLILNYRLPKILRYQAFINDSNYLKASSSENYYLDGYFQYDQTWETIKDSVFWIREHMIAGLCMPKSTGFVVHARGGDFLKNPLSVEHEIKHFSTAINHINTIPDRKVLVCSDEAHATRVHKFFKDRGIDLDYVPSHDDDWMASFLDIFNAEVLIGGRSTFAWWASALGGVVSYLPIDFEFGYPRSLHHIAERF